MWRVDGDEWYFFRKCSWYMCTIRGHFPTRWMLPDNALLVVSSAWDTSIVDARSSAQSVEYLSATLRSCAACRRILLGGASVTLPSASWSDGAALTSSWCTWYAPFCCTSPATWKRRCPARFRWACHWRWAPLLEPNLWQRTMVFPGGSKVLYQHAARRTFSY